MRVFARAPRLAEWPEPGTDASAARINSSLTVVVPAYNEVANIATCLTSLLRCDDPCGDWRVLLVDDCSSDATVAIAQEAAGACGTTQPRFTLLDAGPRRPVSADGADLLSLAPRLGCGCLSEWMVQPIMARLLGLVFPIEASNDPVSAVAFAAGPFMLIRRRPTRRSAATGPWRRRWWRTWPWRGESSKAAIACITCWGWMPSSRALQCRA